MRLHLLGFLFFLFYASLMAQTMPDPRKSPVVVSCPKAMQKECMDFTESVALWWGKETAGAKPTPLIRLKVSLAGENLTITGEVVTQTFLVQTPTEQLEFELYAPLSPISSERGMMSSTTLIAKVQKAVADIKATPAPIRPLRPVPPKPQPVAQPPRRNTAAVPTPPGGRSAAFLTPTKKRLKRPPYYKTTPNTLCLFFFKSAQKFNPFFRQTIFPSPN